jgi:hypothetical protein
VAAVVSLSLVASSAAVMLSAGWFDEPLPGHTFLSRRPDGSPYRWDPCRPIHYVVNTAGAPAGALDDVREAVRRMSDATGIESVDDGLTTVTVQQQERAAYVGEGGAFLPVLITWEQGVDDTAFADAGTVAFGVPVTDGGDRYRCTGAARSS